MKKKYIAAIVLTASLLSPALCFPSFIIALSNGHSFITEEWWNKENQILFYQYGGVVGLNKEAIKNIEESDLAVSGMPIRSNKDKSIEDLSDNFDLVGVYDENSEKMDKVASKTTVTEEMEQNFRLEKHLLDNRMNAAIAIFYKTKNAREKEAFKKAQRNISQLDRKKQVLQRKTMKAYGGELPDWWHK